MSAVPTGDVVSGARVNPYFVFGCSGVQKKRNYKVITGRVCQDAVDDGFDYVEAYPLKEYTSEAKDFMGPADLFRKTASLYVMKQKISLL